MSTSLMVILGAGASFDSVDLNLDPAIAGPNGQFRPPLAASLFEPRPNFGAALDAFPAMLPLVNRLRSAAARGQLIEETLKEIEEEASTYPPRHEQLLAIRCYLQWIIANCGGVWRSAAHGVTRFDELVDEVERWRSSVGGEVVYVTFNYDVMLEAALSLTYRLSFNDMSSYLMSGVSLIKLHGSVDWGRLVTVPQVISQHPSVNSPGVQKYLFDKAGQYEPGGFVKAGVGTWVFEEMGVIPAIAIPIAGK